MVKKNRNQVWWKIIIVLTFILSLTSALVLIYNKSPRYEYDVQIIQLNNSNFFENIWVVDYLCDEGIRVMSIQHSILWNIHSFYASAWIDADVHKGECAIKVKRRIK